MDYFVYYHAEATKSWVIRLKAIARKLIFNLANNLYIISQVLQIFSLL